MHPQLSRQNPPWITTGDMNDETIRQWVDGTFSRRSVHRNTLGGPYWRVPGYSEGVIVEAPLTVPRSCLRPLVHANRGFRILLDHRSIPVPFHLLNFIDPQPDLS